MKALQTCSSTLAVEISTMYRLLQVNLLYRYSSKFKQNTFHPQLTTQNSTSTPVTIISRFPPLLTVTDTHHQHPFTMCKQIYMVCPQCAELQYSYYADRCPNLRDQYGPDIRARYLCYTVSHRIKDTLEPCPDCQNRARRAYERRSLWGQE